MFAGGPGLREEVVDSRVAHLKRAGPQPLLDILETGCHGIGELRSLGDCCSYNDHEDHNDASGNHQQRQKHREDLGHDLA